MVFKTIGLDPLDAIINVRLTNEEKMRLQDDADMAALSMSALVRARYFGRPVIANADHVMVKELRRWVFRSIVPTDSGPSCPAIPVHRAHSLRSIVPSLTG